MTKNWLNAAPADSDRGLDIVRVAVALILIVHPIHGLIHPGDIDGFGGFLSSVGLPFGVPLAWATIFIQLACSVALIARRVVVAACLGHMGILSAGIWIIHAPEGWFVVGAGRVVRRRRRKKWYGVQRHPVSLPFWRSLGTLAPAVKFHHGTFSVHVT